MARAGIQSEREDICEMGSSEHFGKLQIGVASVLDIMSEVLLT